jgi:hypothetical protein
MPALDSTDARYLEISREMYASGDWIVPRLATRPHLDKPPLTYWAAALGYTALASLPVVCPRSPRLHSRCWTPPPARLRARSRNAGLSC